MGTSVWAISSEQRHDDRDCNMGKEYCDIDLRAEDDGSKYDDCRRSTGNNGETDFVNALYRRTEWFARFICAMPKYALSYYDGVIDKHTDGEHQAHHRKDV